MSLHCCPVSWDGPWVEEEEEETPDRLSSMTRLSSEWRLTSFRVVAWRKFCTAVTGVCSLSALSVHALNTKGSINQERVLWVLVHMCISEYRKKKGLMKSAGTCTYLDSEGPTDSLRSDLWTVVGFVCFCVASLAGTAAFLTVTVVFFRAACCVCLSLFLTPACLLAGTTTLVTAYSRTKKKNSPSILYPWSIYNKHLVIIIDACMD